MKTITNQALKKIIFSALFLAVGTILPFFTAQIKEIGDSLLPMHIPVMLCGLICGAKYGLVVGFLLPVFRSVLFSMPPFYPNSIWMAFELATYGFVIGILYNRRKKASTGYLYFCLITSMISGRIIWGITKTILLGLTDKAFTFHAFIVEGIIDALPGIALQLIIIPPIMSLVRKNIEV